MTSVYAVAVAIGCVGLFVWIVLVAAANVGTGNGSVDPERWAGRRGRITVAAVLGFGLAGLSASYGGWATLPALLAAAVGAAGLGVAANWLGPDADTDADA